MAAKKITKKSAPKKALKKSPSKAVKKPTAEKAVNKAPAKKVVKKVAAEKTIKKVAKKAPVKKAAAKVVKKVAAEKAIKKVTKKAPVKKSVKKAPAKVVKKESKAPKKPTAKKASRKPSLGGAPPPPAPAKPRFVPPKADFMPKSSSNGSGRHTAAFIKKQGIRLVDLRESLVESMTGMTRDTIRNGPEGSEASGSGQHQGDAGSDAYDRDFALSLLSKEQDALYEVEQALFRIKTDTYGNCEISSHKIPAARLEAIPFARLTVECQADWEKEYGNRRFKPSDEVGFSGGIPQEDGNSVTVSLDGDDD